MSFVNVNLKRGDVRPFTRGEHPQRSDADGVAASVGTIVPEWCVC